MRFCFQGVQYQYSCLPFGYSLGPCTSSKCMETALQPLRSVEMRLFFYLDDLLLLPRSREEAEEQMRTLVTHLSCLGFSINGEKGSAVPSQLIVYLGVELNSTTRRAHLSQLRREILTSLLQCVRAQRSVTVLSVMYLLGMMAGAHIVFLLGLLHVKCLQR